MDDQLKKRLDNDSTGLLTYEYIANNIGEIDDVIDELVDNIVNVDKNGQFAVSTARYLNAIDKAKYWPQIDRLIKAAITLDRERAYLPDLAASIWGNDYKQRASQLAIEDDNFRRVYKRLYPSGM